MNDRDRQILKLIWDKPDQTQGWHGAFEFDFFDLIVHFLLFGLVNDIFGIFIVIWH